MWAGRNAVKAKVALCLAPRCAPNRIVAALAADEAAADALAQLNDIIRAEVAAGTPVADIVKVTGLTRARIYQIRDHRR